MQNIKKYFMTLALLLTAVTGAWAQDADEVAVTKTANNNEWTLMMPASNIELQVEYYAESNIFLGKEALADKDNITVKNGETTVEFDDKGKSTTTVTEGNTVTTTYSGTKKILGMKAEKKAESLIVNPVVGQIIGSDGKNYDANATLPDGVTKVAMIAYVGNGSDCTNGLAIQLNGSPVGKNWTDAKTYAEGLTAVSGGTWRLPSKDDWQNMFVGCAVSGDASASDNMKPIAGFNAKIAATGIIWEPASYWSSTWSGSNAWRVEVYLDGSNARAVFFEEEYASDESTLYYVFGCLAF